ncbi:hypothetical protein ACFQDN_21570 [Pseudomonas asuensis]|uniref:Uncharacterized protein n=1 Tax=Pseudomonas asuensis TaxID=1825787 RepID=A0ABQ2H1K5_9PSED|nr:hypothetical protein [Pseudomonas asuensis]GGM26181.1 hypothetical protein GCM10009425_41120 [Pseudomonas asuensis]
MTIDNDLDHWLKTLKDIKEKKRPRLNGSEYKALIEAIEDSRAEPALRQIAKQVIRDLAIHQGAAKNAYLRETELEENWMSNERPGIENPKLAYMNTRETNVGKKKLVRHRPM